MSRISPTKRKMQIKGRQKRHQKLGKLRAKYRSAKGILEKEKILEKVSRLAPWLSEKEFLLEKETKEIKK